jgi:hypothetical protein
MQAARLNGGDGKNGGTYNRATAKDEKMRCDASGNDEEARKIGEGGEKERERRRLVALDAATELESEQTRVRNDDDGRR